MYKFFPDAYPVTRVHPLHIDDKQTTDDNRVISSALLKYGRLKNHKVTLHVTIVNNSAALTVVRF